MKSQNLSARFPRFSPAGNPAALLAVAALLALAALLPGPQAAQAQSEGATQPQSLGLHVSIEANPVSPRVNESTTLTATITNSPSEETPTYNWEIDFGGSSWLSWGGGSTFRYGNGRAETLRFRLTVSYDSGESATSEPVAVTWVVPESTQEPTPTPSPQPTAEPTSTPTPTPSPQPTAEPTSTPTPTPSPQPTEEPTPTSPPALSVSGVEVTSDAGDDDTYALSDTIRITLTFSEKVDVTGSPQLAIDMDPAEWGEKWAEYEGGGGTASLTFVHTVVEPNYSTQGIAVLANSLDLNGGTIRSTSSDTGADLSHLGLPHDSAHKVDWQQSTSEQPTSTPTPEPTPQPAPTAEPTPTPTPVPSVSGVEVTSDAGDDDTYALGNIVHITLTFSEKVYVTGSPQLAIDMDPAEWGEKPAAYISGSGTARLIFSYTVVEPNISTQGIAVLENSLDLNGGSIKSASSDTEAELSHVGLDHDARHKVDWQRTQPNRAPVVNTQSANYDRFTGNNNAPRGVLVSKPFYQVFTDPDGDELTFAVSIPEEHRRLVEELAVTLDKDFQPETRGWPPIGAYDRVFFQAADDAEWKAISPALPDPVPVTATLTATDPEGLSVSLDGDFLIHWESHPVLVKATASEQAIELTFDTAVEDDPTPKPGQFTVNVANADGTAGTVSVSNVSVSGNVVTLGLASGLATGQTVTVDYAHDADTPLKRDSEGGDHAASFTGQAVDMSLLNPPGQPQNFAVSVRRGQLALSATWDAVEGATSYRLRWRKTGGEFQAANATTVTDTSATITVSAYGEWEVRLQACNDSGCAPETGGSEDETPAVRLSLEPAQDAESQAQSRTRSVTATHSPAADENSYTAGWQREGTDSQSQGQSLPDATGQTRGIGGPSGAVNLRSSDQTDTTPPRLVRGEIDGDTMTFYFSEPMDESATGSQFRVTLHFGYGWANFTAHPSRVEVSGSKVVVHSLSRNGWPHWERAGTGYHVRVYYYKDDRVFPAGQRLRDLAGNEVATPHRSPGGHFPATRTIWLQNLTAPPALRSAEAYPRWLTLTFDERLDANSVPAVSAFTVTVNGSTVSLAGDNPVSVAGDTLTLVLASPLASTDTMTVSYARPSTNPLRGPDGKAPSFSGQSVTNLVGQVPSVSQMAITSTPADGEAYAPDETVQVSLTFTERVNVTGTPRLRIKLAPTYGKKWATYSGGSGTATLTFGYTVAEPDRSTRGVAVLRDRLELNGGTIRSTATQKDAHRWHPGLDHDANHMVDWHRSASGVPWVTGVAITSDPGADGVYARGDVIQVTATFSEAVNVDTTSGTPRLKIKMNPYIWWMYGFWFGWDNEERWADYTGGSGTSELAFTYTVVEVNRSTRGVAVLESGLELNGGTIRSTDATPVNAHLRYGGLDHDPDHLVDGKAPALLDVAVAGTKVSVAFDEALDGDAVPPASAFTVKRTPQGGSEETVSLSGAPTIAGGAVILTLSDAVAATDTDVKVSYAKPASANKLKDKADNEAAGFTDRAIDATDTTPPRLLWGQIDGDILTIYFSEPLDEDSASLGVLGEGRGDHFRLTLDHRRELMQDGQCPDVSRSFSARHREVHVRGNVVVVDGLHNTEWVRASVHWTLTNFYYIADTALTQRLRDLSGNYVSTSEPYAGNSTLSSTRVIILENVTWLPYPRSARVVGDRLTLTFSAPMDGALKPAAGAFTVKVNGSAVNLAGSNPVAVSGREVTLTLAAAVVASDTVTVSYDKPESSPLRNIVCEFAPSFTDQPVTNSTP